MTSDRSRWIADPDAQLRVTPGFDLSKHDTAGTPGFTGSKKDGVAALHAASKALTDLQDRLWASGVDGEVRPRSILLVLQGMDTSGKGGIVGHVVGAVNPMGVRYTGFKKPTKEELEHDFLWRVRPHVPEPGIIAVFDRSHYEDVLIGRVRNLAPEEEIERRYGAINGFEREISESGTTIIKVMMHLGHGEQRRRLEERLDRPDKYWKFNPADIDERELWPAYMDAYQRVLDRTSTDVAPWHVIPVDHKWYARLAVQQLLIDALERMNLAWPPARFDIDEQRLRLAAS